MPRQLSCACAKLTQLGYFWDGRATCIFRTLQWSHNDHDSVSNHQPHDCLLNRLFRRRSKKTSKLRVTGLCAGIHRWPVNSPHKRPVTRKMFPFDDVIMRFRLWAHKPFVKWVLPHCFVHVEIFPTYHIMIYLFPVSSTAVAAVRQNINPDYSPFSVSDSNFPEELSSLHMFLLTQCMDLV